MPPHTLFFLHIILLPAFFVCLIQRSPLGGTWAIGNLIWHSWWQRLLSIQILDTCLPNSRSKGSPLAKTACSGSLEVLEHHMVRWEFYLTVLEIRSLKSRISRAGSSCGPEGESVPSPSPKLLGVAGSAWCSLACKHITLVLVCLHGALCLCISVYKFPSPFSHKDTSHSLDLGPA